MTTTLYAAFSHKRRRRAGAGALVVALILAGAAAGGRDGAHLTTSTPTLLLRTRGTIFRLETSRARLGFFLRGGNRLQGAVRSRPKTLLRYALPACFGGRSEWSLALAAKAVYWECDDGGSIPAAAMLFGVTVPRGKPFRVAESTSPYSLSGDGSVTVVDGGALWKLSGPRLVPLPIRMPPLSEIVDVAAGRMLVVTEEDHHEFVVSLDGKRRQRVPSGLFLTPSFVVDTVSSAGSSLIRLYDIATGSPVHEWPLPFRDLRDLDAAGDFAVVLRSTGLYIVQLSTGAGTSLDVSGRIAEAKVGPDGVYHVKNARGYGEIYFVAPGRRDTPGDNELVFYHPDLGTPLDPSELTRSYVKPALKRTGITKKLQPWHGLRHTALMMDAATRAPNA